MRLRHPAHWLALGFGSGLSPFAPGTAGTLVAIPLYLLLQPLAPLSYALIVAALFLLGVWACGRASRDLGIKDAPVIVFDEIVGYFVTMFMAPPGWLWVLAGFVLFRFMDIVKPFPARQAEALPGGLGVMMDDLLAGVYAGLLLQAVVLLL